MRRRQAIKVVKTHVRDGREDQCFSRYKNTTWQKAVRRLGSEEFGTMVTKEIVAEIVADEKAGRNPVVNYLRRKQKEAA